jgi:hypothetical protein
VRGYWIALIIALTIAALALKLLFKRISNQHVTLHQLPNPKIGLFNTDEIIV